MTAETNSNALLAQESWALVREVSKLLAGKHPSVQGACLAELVGMWLAGHEKQVRENLLGLHTDAARSMATEFAVVIKGEKK